MVRQQAIGIASLHHIFRNVHSRAVHETVNQVAGTVKLRRYFRAAFVDECLRQHAVYLLANAPIPSIHEILDRPAICKYDPLQVAIDVVGVGRDGGALRHLGEFSVGAVCISRQVVSEHPILIVITRDGDPIYLGSVAVPIVVVRSHHLPVLRDGLQATCEVVAVYVAGRASSDRFSPADDPFQRVIPQV